MSTFRILNYEFEAVRRKNGLLISGHLGGQVPGVPYLRPEASPSDDVRVYRLIFSDLDGPHGGGFSYLETQPSPRWRTIRILLPKAHEYVIHSRHPGEPWETGELKPRTA